MQRKLVQMGKHCLMAAIPKKWLKHHNLQKGEYIAFEEVEQYLIISPKPLPKDKSLSITLQKANRVGVFRTLAMLYDSGYKTVRIKYDNPQVLTWLLWSVNSLEEWRLESLDKNHCIIKSILVEREDFHVQFRRIMLLTKELGYTFLEFLKGDKELIEDIRAKHQLILAGTQSIKRMINTSSLPLEYKYYYFISIQLEEIANQYDYLLINIENQKKIPKNVVLLQDKLCTFFDETYNNFYKFDLGWFIDLSKKLVWKWFETEKNSLLVYHQRAISERIKNIAKYSIGIKLH